MTVDQAQATQSSWFGTMPGVITAIAAVITAVGGVYGVYLANQQPAPPPTPVATAPVDGPTTAPTSDPVEETDPPAPPPEDEVDAEPVAIDDELEGDDGALVRWYSLLALEDQAVVDDCVTGYTSSCVAVSAALVQECQYDGTLACDVLYEISDVGTELESYGATCGYRWSDWTFAGVCSP